MSMNRMLTAAYTLTIIPLAVAHNYSGDTILVMAVCAVLTDDRLSGNYSGDTILVMAVCAVLTDDRLSGVSIRDQQGFLNDPRMLHFQPCHARRLYTLAYFVNTSIVSPE